MKKVRITTKVEVKNTNILYLNSYQIVENEQLYGPGKRLLLFTQGCSIHCKNCINKQLWPFTGGKEFTPEDIEQLIKENCCEGITLHGGEPMDQCYAVNNLIRYLKKQGYTTVLFTGYDKKQFYTKHQNPVIHEQKMAFEAADIVVAGPYIEKLRNCYLQFRGSTNQKVYTHKGPYKNYQIKDGTSNAFLTVDSDGNLNVNGFMTDELAELIGEKNKRKD